LTILCADMASGISRKLAEDSEWQLELLDESKQPAFAFASSLKRSIDG
jgi:hypothetical protein